MTIRWKVALVEDDRRLARAVSAGLGQEGYTVRSVDSADRGLQLVRQWNPDVVLLDLSEGTAVRGIRALGVTGIEFRILAALMRNRGRLVTYAQLAEAVWAQDAGPESNSLEVHVSRIRQKLEAGGERRLVHTVRGIGYRFTAED